VALAWARGPRQGNVVGRYVGRYTDYQDVIPNTNELGNFWIVDCNFRYEVAQRSMDLFAGTFIAIGASNLLNREPRFSYGFTSYDALIDDIRGTCPAQSRRASSGNTAFPGRRNSSLPW